MIHSKKRDFFAGRKSGVSLTDESRFGTTPLEIEIEDVEESVAALGRLQNDVDGAADERRDQRETARLETASLVFEEITREMDGDLLERIG